MIKIKDSRIFNNVNLSFDSNINLIIGGPETGKSRLLYKINNHAGDIILFNPTYVKDEGNCIIDYVRQVYGKPTLKYLNEVLSIVGFEIIVRDNPKFKYDAIMVKNMSANVEAKLMYDLSVGSTRLIYQIVMLIEQIGTTNNDKFFIDTPESNIHPSLHHKLFEVYTKIANTYGVQLFIATNSPHFISMSTSIHELNISNNGKTDITKISSQFLDRDANTILKTIMGTDYIPEFIVKLHQEYRKCVNDGLKCDKLEKNLLRYESLNSSFFMDVSFDEELNN